MHILLFAHSSYSTETVPFCVIKESYVSCLVTIIFHISRSRPVHVQSSDLYNMKLQDGRKREKARFI